ncbi:hypothetical protein BDV29DRAFT_172170 [Aspergillus leporis]|uniref:Uncharacterized protein n=1 Tax=Aspergillus leporis TaxID=41062 RepID=A0A5N5X396_9EURO|nr:hypothetical protein BDV29DRAFT_172170 [Aspergillus leporis]
MCLRVLPIPAYLLSLPMIILLAKKRSPSPKSGAHQRRYLEGFEERLQSWFNNCKIAIDNAHMESCCAITVLHCALVLGSLVPLILSLRLLVENQDHQHQNR